MVYQKNHAKDSALGDACLLMDVVKPERGDCRSKEDGNQGFWGNEMEQIFFYCFHK